MGGQAAPYPSYCVTRRIPIRELLAHSGATYPHAHDCELMALEGLVLFDNVDRDVQPELLGRMPWPEVREFFLAPARSLGREWFGNGDG